MDTLLQIKDLTKQFGSTRAIDNLSLQASAGEIFGLLGPNGAGKTTTIRVISTVITPTEGTASVCGHDVAAESEKARECIGVLTTDIGLYERFSGKENLEYFGRLYGMRQEQLDKRIEELTQLLAMQDFIDRKAGEYSTGMKQKLAIARCVIHDPRIIILDEPTSGLDVLASQTVLSFMRQARDQGKCVIFSTHHMNDAEKLCDRVAIIHRGKLITTDTIESILLQTSTDNLEQAFLELVKSEPEIDDPEQSEKGKKKFPIPLRIIGIGIIVIGALIGFINKSENEILRYIVLGCFILGAIVSFIGKSLEKKK